MAPFLRLSGVGKRFGGVVALADIDWDVRPGEVHCLVGENGCGKSTLIKTVAGVHPPSSGTIEIAGRPALPLSPAKARALGIQVIFQDLSLFPNLSVAENIAVETHLEKPARPVSYAEMRRLAKTVLARLDFHLDPAALVADLAVAERQIVAICRGLAAEARGLSVAIELDGEIDMVCLSLRDPQVHPVDGGPGCKESRAYRSG